MKRSTHSHTAKKIGAAALALVLCGILAACNRVDTTEDPLSAYEASDAQPTQAPTPVPTVFVTATPAPTVSSYSFSRLEFGDEGDDVTRLQNRLIELGYMDPGTADGKYGESTKTAIKAFQGALGLSKTGIANINLQQKLFLANAPAYVAATPTPSPVPVATPRPATQAPAATANSGAQSSTGRSSGYSELSKGSWGDEVRALQTRLIKLGYLRGTADGSYGDQTVNAVKKFQAAIGMSQTGVATAYVQEVLYASGAPAAATPVPTAPPRFTPTPRPTPTPVPEEYHTLRQGQYSESIMTMQRRLKQLGYLTGSADGDYGRQTVEAVAKFQAAIGMDVDGTYASGYMQERLYSNGAPVYVAPTPEPAPVYHQLTTGSTGDEVKRLQRRLKELGYFDGDVAGNYLSKTTAAVKKFQTAAGFDVNGVATVELQEFLFSSAAPAAAATTVPAPQVTPKPVAQATPRPAETAYRYRQLSYGDTGAPVKTLQTRLKELGYFDGNIGGNYLDLTVAAVKRFQAATGFDVNGVATVELQEFLFSSAAPAYFQPQQPTPAPTAAPQSASSGYVRLSYGDSGNRVKKIQARLKELGFFDGNVAGNYLDKTRAAVTAFQKAAGLTANGVATVETQEALFSANAPAAGSGSGQSESGSPSGSSQNGQYTTLGPGSTGNAVKRLQSRLIELGYLKGSADGDYGGHTIEAVKRFQTALGMDNANGTATGYVQEKLFAANAPAHSSGGRPQTASDQYTPLGPGDEGDEVRNLQKRLHQLGYYRRDQQLNDYEMGSYDNETRRAVRDFQRMCGYAEEDADGLATVGLQELLFSDDALNFAAMDDPQ